jgi:hypothetical protein
MWQCVVGNARSTPALTACYKCRRLASLCCARCLSQLSSMDHTVQHVGLQHAQYMPMMILAAIHSTEYVPLESLVCARVVPGMCTVLQTLAHVSHSTGVVIFTHVFVQCFVCM